MSKCLICEETVSPFINFGPMPIANGFLDKNETNSEYKFILQVGFCNNCKMVQLLEQPEKEKMFHSNYSFFSSTSNSMKSHFKFLFDLVKKRKKLNHNSFVIEIGCNDGILLENFNKDKIPSLGIEPSGNVAEVARSKGLSVNTNFFDEKLAEKILLEYSKADLLISANVICHIPYIHSIFSGVKKIMKDDGLFVYEDPYLGDIIEKTSFDQIYDEHVFLFSAISVQNLANRHGLELTDIQKINSHGGSMRYFISHKDKNIITKNVSSLIKKEKDIGLDQLKTYNNFEKDINNIKNDLITLLKKLKSENKKVVAYGATSKSTTVTNYFGIDNTLIDAIYDNTPIKQNKLSPGKHIEVLPYEKFRLSDPDYVLLFAWNHQDEIFKKENDYMKNNRKWITYIPSVKIH